MFWFRGHTPAESVSSMYTSIGQLNCDWGVYMKEKVNLQSQYLGVVQWFIQEGVTLKFYTLEGLLLKIKLSST